VKYCTFKTVLKGSAGEVVFSAITRDEFRYFPTVIGGTVEHTIEAVGETVGIDEVVIPFIQVSCSGCDVPPGQCTLFPSILEVADASAFDSQGIPLMIETLDGHLRWTSLEGATPVMEGWVYYSDGFTPYCCGTVEIVRIDTLPLRLLAGAMGGRYYPAYVLLPGIERYHTIYAKAYDPVLCIETEVEAIQWDSYNSGELIHHDFILPINVPTATVSQTATPTASRTDTPTSPVTPSPTPIASETPTAMYEVSDINQDGEVNADDLLILLNQWRIK
jgi:hypothetical protein